MTVQLSLGCPCRHAQEQGSEDDSQGFYGEKAPAMFNWEKLKSDSSGSSNGCRPRLFADSPIPLSPLRSALRGTTGHQRSPVPLRWACISCTSSLTFKRCPTTSVLNQKWNSYFGLRGGSHSLRFQSPETLMSGSPYWPAAATAFPMDTPAARGI